jgi:hypothetical protein
MSGTLVRDMANQAPGAPLASGQKTPCALAVLLPGAYWINNGDGTIAWKNLNEQPNLTPAILASGQEGACAIAVDSVYVYWTNCTKGAIFRVPRP